MEYTLDILINSRLYLAKWKDLNDAMEGVFWSKSETIKNTIEDGKADKRVCSFSKTCEELLLWGYYASGFKGLAIEFEIDKGAMKEVRYQDDLKKIITEVENAQDVATKMLTRKLTSWQHEREFRIVTPVNKLGEEYYSLTGENKITKVIVGSRMNDAIKKIYETICNAKEIKFSMAEPSGEDSRIKIIDDFVLPVLA